MKITLRFFAGVREVVGTGSDALTVPESVRTVGDVRQFLCERGDPWAQALAEGRALRMALNQEMVTADTPITDGCELAFFPPVTGG
ncbi:Molybdenum cofactor biosynthesis protein D; Molybdopterin converting factor subunit 1 [Oxalobacteraceae bacterium IMCC9480]|nr:Molybdenum cofactor biosynthesis protein D; Molybdopterin converting factor subunit 1 [Oxalobacteraceae bacterium IMCC9480]NDP60012.1 molybdopterin converting factor subunit 1 [Oxalobacteraceae bacterium]